MIITTCGTIKNGSNEFAHVVYNKIINLPEVERNSIPYKTELDLTYENQRF
jgi:hypothetical protein